MPLLDEKEMAENDEQVVIVANSLFNTYAKYTNDEGKTSLNGLTAMEGIMDSVPYEYRGQVFAHFLAILQDNGVHYDPKVFQQRPSEAVH